MASGSEMIIDLHIGILNTNRSNGKTLQLSAGKMRDIAVVNVAQLWSALGYS